MGGATYDRIGVGYTRQRRPDPRWEARIHAALGDAASVLDVGGGAGSYEPSDRPVVCVDPSTVMLAQRRAGAAPAVRGVAENLPFPSGSFEAAMGVFTLHHWADVEGGLAEVARVAPGRQVFVSVDFEHFSERFWLESDYLPEVPGTPTGFRLADHLDVVADEPLPVPADCVDGFFAAYWRRPEAYLDPAVQQGISALALLSDGERADLTRRLGADLESGEWHRRNGHLLDLDELDVGYRLFVCQGK